ncbi:MAG: hypothetical protein QXD62_01985 [Candidatus Woesearchaeota archaeon]
MNFDFHFLEDDAHSTQKISQKKFFNSLDEVDLFLERNLDALINTFYYQSFKSENLKNIFHDPREFYLSYRLVLNSYVSTLSRVTFFYTKLYTTQFEGEKDFVVEELQDKILDFPIFVYGKKESSNSGLLSKLKKEYKRINEFPAKMFISKDNRDMMAEIITRIESDNETVRKALFDLYVARFPYSGIQRYLEISTFEK